MLCDSSHTLIREKLLIMPALFMIGKSDTKRMLNLEEGSLGLRLICHWLSVYLWENHQPFWTSVYSSVKWVSTYIHPTNKPISFLYMAAQYSVVYTYHIFFIHSSVIGDLGCLHVLAIVNSAVMNTEVYVSSWIMVFSGYMPNSGIVGSYVVSHRVK